MDDKELREQIETVFKHYDAGDFSLAGASPVTRIMQLITARDAAKELDIEEHINNLNIGHINSGMGIEDLRRVFEKRQVVIQLRRESDQAKEGK